MRRLLAGDIAYIERLFQTASRGAKIWSRASYPCGCKPRRGSVRFSIAPDDSLVVRVERRELASDDHQLRVLFTTGVGVFATPRELYSFAKGPLALSFGAPAEPAGRPGAADGGQPENSEFDLTIPPANAADSGEVESNGVGKNAERQVASAESRPVAPVQSLLAPEQLVEMLSRVVKGQDAALERVAHVVCAQRAKAAPKQPGTIMLLGPTGTGKTFTVEALPAVLEELGQPGSHVVRVDCNELTQPFQVSRLIGAPPGYVGYDSKPRLLEQLEKPGCILLLDEVDKAHPSVLADVLLNLIDKGRLSSPNGSTVYAEHAVIAMTSNLAVDELALRLHQIPLENRWAVQRICRELLADEGMPAELLSRIGAFAVYQPLGVEALREAAALAVKWLAQEYRLRVTKVDPIIVDVILDIAGESGLGARALGHAASELLALAFAVAVREGASGTVVIDPGPPVLVGKRSAGSKGARRERPKAQA